MATVIKTDDPILSVVAFQKVRAFQANIKAQKLQNQERKMRLGHLQESLTQNAKLEKANADLASSRAIVSGLTKDLRVETQPGAVLKEKVGQAADIGSKVSSASGGMLDAEDLSRVAAGINPKAKPGTLDHSLLLGVIKSAQDKALQEVSMDSLKTIAAQGKVARAFAGNEQGVQLLEENFPTGHPVPRMARAEREKLLAEPSRLQFEFDKREVKQAQETLAEGSLGEAGALETIKDPPTGFFGGVKEDKVTNAQRVIDRANAARSTLRRLGLEPSPAADIQKTTTDQPTAPPATPAKPAQTGRNSPIARATKFINQLDFGPNVTKADDLPDGEVANILGRLTADKGISIKKEVLDRLITRRIKAQRTDEKARARGARLQANPPPRPARTLNTPQG